LECRDARQVEEGTLKKNGRSRDAAVIRRGQCSKEKDAEHSSTTFIAITRMDEAELTKLVCEMEATPPCIMATAQLGEEVIQSYYTPAASDQSRGYLNVPEKDIDPRLSLLIPHSLVTLASRAEQARTLFHTLWSRGEPMVVSIFASDRVKLAWTPGQFIEDFGEDHCTLVDNRNGDEEESTVAEFFQRFLTKTERTDGASHKIKVSPNTMKSPQLFAHAASRSLATGLAGGERFSRCLPKAV
jgi:hypothetical protein